MPGGGWGGAGGRGSGWWEALGAFLSFGLLRVRSSSARQCLCPPGAVSSGRGAALSGGTRGAKRRRVPAGRLCPRRLVGRGVAPEGRSLGGGSASSGASAALPERARSSRLGCGGNCHVGDGNTRNSECPKTVFKGWGFL